MQANDGSAVGKVVAEARAVSGGGPWELRIHQPASRLQRSRLWMGPSRAGQGGGEGRPGVRGLLAVPPGARPREGGVGAWPATGKEEVLLGT